MEIPIADAIKILVENGCDISCGLYRLYHDSKGKFTILHFDRNANLKDEESFEDIDDAISKMIRRCKGKLS